MNFEKINIGSYIFLKLQFKNANFIFSTGENNLNLNIEERKRKFK